MSAAPSLLAFMQAASAAAPDAAPGWLQVVEDAVGWVPAVVFPVATILQLVSLIHRGRADGVSATTWALFALANACLYVTIHEWLRPQVKPVQGNARSLPKHLQKTSSGAERRTIVLAGCEAHVCLLQTALDLLEDEFDVWVVTDACGSRTERNRDAAFDRLAGAGVELVTTEMVAFEWIRSAEHPDFKAAQALIK